MEDLTSGIKIQDPTLWIDSCHVRKFPLGSDLTWGSIRQGNFLSALFILHAALLLRDYKRMPPAGSSAGTVVSDQSHEHPTIILIAAIASLIWYCVVALVCIIGDVQIWRHFSCPKPRAQIDPSAAPHVTIIRPVKGLEPRLYDCLASTFRQDYPRDKLHFRFCVSDNTDPSIPAIRRLLQDFPQHDAQLLLEDEDEMLKTREGDLGPNPKIRNMSRAYREAVGDIIWVIDCNVWIAKGVCGRMVAKLEGYGKQQKNKLVHQLPLVVDIVGGTAGDESRGLLNGHVHADAQIRTTSSASSSFQSGFERTASSIGGGRLEEAFMSSSHPKFYTAINTVLVAPCIVGKSTMFRRSHLNNVTDDAGIDYFSQNICEDHLIGDLLWKSQVPEERRGEKVGKHAMCFGDLAIQPMANMSVTYGAFALTTLPILHNILGIPQTWNAFVLFWFLSVAFWCGADWALYNKLQSGASIEADEDTPSFARPSKTKSQRSFGTWLLAWLGREALALPIWMWAFWGGTKVEWRGKKFWVGMDMKVHEISDQYDGIHRTVSPSKGRRLS